MAERLKQTAESLLNAAKEIATRDPEIEPKIANLVEKQYRIGAHTVLAKRELDPKSKRELGIATWVLFLFNLAPIVMIISTQDISKSIEAWEIIAIVSTGVVCCIVYRLDYLQLCKDDQAQTQRRPAHVLSRACL